MSDVWSVVGTCLNYSSLFKNLSRTKCIYNSICLVLAWRTELDVKKQHLQPNVQFQPIRQNLDVRNKAGHKAKPLIVQFHRPQWNMVARVTPLLVIEWGRDRIRHDEIRSLRLKFQFLNYGRGPFDDPTDAWGVAERCPSGKFLLLFGQRKGGSWAVEEGWWRPLDMYMILARTM